VLPGTFFVAACLAEDVALADVRFHAMRTLGGPLPAIERKDAGRTLVASDVDDALASARAVDSRAFDMPGTADAATDETLDGEALYARLARQGNDYGESFRTLRSLERSGSTARASWRAPADGEAVMAMVTLLDACAHASAIAAGLSTTYYLDGIARVQRDASRSVASGDRTIVATLRAENADGCTVDCHIRDADGHVVAFLDGLELRRFADDAERLAVAGTFTLDPLDDVATLWSRQLGLPLTLARADYGQVHQPLLAADGAFDDLSQSHTCLVRIGDWAPSRAAPPVPSRERVDAALNGLSRHLMPDGRTVASLNKYETAYLYQEIFNDLAYRRHGVRVLKGDTVIDIGANIGLFTLFASGEAENVRVISVEPSPVVLPILKANIALHAPGGTVIEAGASNAAGTARFTAYRNSSVFSSFDADEGADEEAIRQVIRNSLEAMGQDDERLLEEAVEEMIQGRLDAEEFDCTLVSVSDIIREHGLTRIDLLKIDAEKSEDAILAGIEDAHWALIDQVIIEVHLQGGRSDAHVVELLEGHGFEVVRDEEELLNDSGLIGLYAARPERFTRNAAAGEEPAIRESAELFVDAAKAHAARAATPLDVVLCPADVRDPTVRALHESVEGDLLERLAELPATNVFRWADFAARYPVANAHDTLGGALADMPYTPEWYAATGTAIVRRHVASRRQAAKIVVLDCDNTLWGGVVGEDGVDGVRIGPEHAALHESIRRLIDRGVLFALASKNVVADVRAVFERRDDFALDWSDVVAERVNWQPKADNLLELATELKLGLDAFVFLDDSPLECEELRVRLPEVLTLRMPENPDAFARFLDHVWAFDQRGVTAEDERRAAMYREESRRRTYREDAGSIESFIEGLALEVGFEALDEGQLERASQMSQRTNQFNLTTRRRSVEELRTWLGDGDGVRGGSVLRVADRFGDYGVTGLVLHERDGDALVVDTFLLSCRVLGRGVEHRIVAHLGEVAAREGLASVALDFVPTVKNEPARRFLEKLGGERESRGEAMRIRVPHAEARTFSHDPGDVGAASDAVAKGAHNRPSLPPAPSLEVERIARELASAASIAEAVRDRAHVPRPTLEVAHVVPRSELETRLAVIWGELLGIDGIGVDDGFFDLGGTSLGAVQMVAEVQRSLGLAVSVVDVFEAPTIAGLARAADGGTKGSEVESSRQRGAERRARRAARPMHRARG